MWIAQGLVSSQVEDGYDVGRSYIQKLIFDAKLVLVSQIGGDGPVKSCKIDDLSHKFVSETLKQPKSLLMSGQQLNSFPDQCREVHIISVIKN